MATRQTQKVADTKADLTSRQNEVDSWALSRVNELMTPDANTGIYPTSPQEAISKAVDEANLLYPDVKVRKRPTITNVPTAFRHYSAETGELITVAPTGKKTVEKIGTPSLIGDIRQEQLAHLKRINEDAKDATDLRTQMQNRTLPAGKATLQAQRYQSSALAYSRGMDTPKIDPAEKERLRKAQSDALAMAEELGKYAAGMAAPAQAGKGRAATRKELEEASKQPNIEAAKQWLIHKGIDPLLPVGP